MQNKQSCKRSSETSVAYHVKGSQYSPGNPLFIEIVLHLDFSRAKREKLQNDSFLNLFEGKLPMKLQFLSPALFRFQKLHLQISW